ncbi:MULTISPECIES: HTH-type sugar sensing transcriptional regulator TrmB [Haloferax]|uniref:MarR family transcriptional regulator n=4 Tax=Haloferax TaxID=2251 RepID=A0A558G928_HALVO|nr:MULTISPECIES: TrmB family transcriptional regulator [Haloferax]ELK52298.1 sugar-specific transcriptional regulator TrmB [Haloferax sp. BAB-2207]ELZ76723.1 sugar-specific transcriptional regulator TrmB [Haloferax lucentense DSM 14919]ELZ86318.1 sugar-specific transcriptional regulator TrmB [Haloferax alexandrinus JCM 10717]MBC9987367.1 TrmB family transcriptional regulator [Haloferax sp. AS1]NLV04298.1 MarR family transcriptional regulator [Haloferax alexandrinus]
MADELRLTMERVGERFNLGEYEIDAYLAVLEHGQLTASEIADRTSIPQPRVYDTVRSLSDRGLVELRESRPMKIVAVDPDDAFANVKTSLEELIEELEARYTAPARDTEAVSLVKSRSTILRYIEEIIEAAEYELVLSLTPDLLRRFRDDLAAAIDSGVSIDLLVTPASRAPDPEEFNYLDVATIARARRGITSPVLAVADGEYSIYATQDALRDDRDRYGVIFNRSALGFLVSGFFGTVLWSTAETIVANGKRRPFPRRYASIRRAVKDIREIDGDFYASVSGRDIETGDPIVVEGRVIETAFEDTEEVASLHIETEEGVVEVGGLVAALEDVEGQEILLGRDEVPNRDEIV